MRRQFPPLPTPPPSRARTRAQFFLLQLSEQGDIPPLRSRAVAGGGSGSATKSTIKAECEFCSKKNCARVRAHRLYITIQSLHDPSGLGSRLRGNDRKRNTCFGCEIPHCATSFANDVAASDFVRDTSLASDVSG